VWLNGSTGLLDENGKVIIPVEYDRIERGREKCIIVSRDSLFGLYHVNGTQLAETKYQEYRTGQIKDTNALHGYHTQAMELRLGDEWEVFDCRE